MSTRAHWLWALPLALLLHLAMATLVAVPVSGGGEAPEAGRLLIARLPAPAVTAPIAEAPPRPAERGESRPVDTAPETPREARDVTERERRATVGAQPVTATPLLRARVEIARPPSAPSGRLDPVSRPHPSAGEAPKPGPPAAVPEPSSLAAETPAGRARGEMHHAPPPDRTRVDGTDAPRGDGRTLAALASSVASAAASGELARRSYVDAVRLRLEQSKRYPRRARRRGQAGTVLVEFEIERSGALLDHRIVQGSGYALLDREVVLTLDRAAPFPPLPENVEGDLLTVRIPIVFELR